MNKEFKKLFTESGLTKYRFCQIIGMQMSNFNKYAKGELNMKEKTFLNYSCKLK